MKKIKDKIWISENDDEILDYLKIIKDHKQIFPEIPRNKDSVIDVIAYDKISKSLTLTTIYFLTKKDDNGMVMIFIEDIIKRVKIDMPMSTRVVTK